MPCIMPPLTGFASIFDTSPGVAWLRHSTTGLPYTAPHRGFNYIFMRTGGCALLRSGLPPAMIPEPLTGLTSSLLYSYAKTGIPLR